MITATFLCLVVSVHDGDTFRCADGRSVRVAAIDANETPAVARRLGRPCHLDRCAAMAWDEARAVATRLILGRPLVCGKVGVSYDRDVARCRLPDGRELGCALIAAGAAVDWPAYRARYRLAPCPRAPD